MVVILEISQRFSYQNITAVKFTYLDGRESSEEKIKFEPMDLEPGLYLNFSNIVLAMNNENR